MNITWYGHAAFRLEGTNEAGEVVQIGLDPYRAGDVGRYLPIDDVADLVAVSHENAKYHSHVAAFRGLSSEPPSVVDGLALLEEDQPYVVRGVPFTAVRVWENDQRREPIAMLGVFLDGVHVLHMGDCGHALGPDVVAACGRVDVLLALAGGAPTLALPDLAAFIDALAPSVVIPMHFGNDRINLNLRPVDDLLTLMPLTHVRELDTSTVTLTPETLPQTTEVWILPPAR